MGMHALGIGPGDEVIMADTNWIATAAPIVHLGAKPVFVDILPDSWCLDPSQVEAAITSRTKAIVAVHLYGNLCEMDQLVAIGERHNIPVIEDSAEAIGSIYRGRRAGSIGKFGAFSFHGTKTITTGEGGIFVTNDLNLYQYVLTLSNHGRSVGQVKQFWPDMVGYKYKMSNIQAAIGLAQLQRINELVSKKRLIFNYYKQSLQSEKVAMNPEPKDCTNSYWMPTVVLKQPLSRDILLQKLKCVGIDARVFFWPLSSTSIPGKKAFGHKYLSESIHLRSINLPSYHDMIEEDIDTVCNIVLESLSSSL